MIRKPGQYWDDMWSPIKMLCTKAGAGCANCWAMRFAHRHEANPTMKREWRQAWAGGEPYLDEEVLTRPLRWKKSRTIFVETMGDIFHESVPDKWIAAVWSAMHRARKHTFLVLTKRSRRMRDFFQRELTLFSDSVLENVQMGISVWDQESADRMIPDLLATPAAVRWISVEPMLAPIDITGYLQGWHEEHAPDCDASGVAGCTCSGVQVQHQARLDWVVAGSETGPGARPAALAWFLALRDQCATAGVPFWYKKGSDRRHTLDGKVHEGLP